MDLISKKVNTTDLDNYVLGALIIYMDIVSLFLQILKILGKKKK